MNVPGDYLEVYVDDLIFDPPPPPMNMAGLAGDFGLAMVPPVPRAPAPFAPMVAPTPQAPAQAPSRARSVDLLLATPDLVLLLLFTFSHANDSVDTVRSGGGGDVSPEPVSGAAMAGALLPPTLFDHSYFRRPLNAHLPRPKYARAPLLSSPSALALAGRFLKPTVTIASIETIDDIQNQRRFSGSKKSKRRPR